MRSRVLVVKEERMATEADGSRCTSKCVVLLTHHRRIFTVRSLPLLVPNVELVVCTVPKMEAGTLGAAGKETRTPVLTNERSAQRLNRVRCGSTDVRDQPVVPSHSESERENGSTE